MARRASATDRVTSKHDDARNNLITFLWNSSNLQETTVKPFSFIPGEILFKVLQSPPRPTQEACMLYNGTSPQDQDYKANQCQLLPGHWDEDRQKTQLHVCKICLEEIQVKTCHPAVSCVLLKTHNLTGWATEKKWSRLLEPRAGGRPSREMEEQRARAETS